MLRTKPGVTFDGLQPEGDEIRAVLEEISQELDCDLTVTCTTKDHGKVDPHTNGFAIDVRTLDLLPDRVVEVFRRAWKKLGAEHYTVRFEVKTSAFQELPDALKEIASINDLASAQHIHIQYRKGKWQELARERGLLPIP